MSKNTPKLTLVGAGPGDADLITLKGIKAIQAADVILYDALANEDLLDYAKKDIPTIYVGKRRGSCAFSQAEINQLIIENALKYGYCVRLKGGDPFIFGRGFEEMEFARAFNIPVEVVPGISSAIAVAEMQHIPLTTRGVSESFWVTTGTTKDNTISSDIALAAQSSATVVILMAMSKIEEIMEIFASHGKSQTPVAIIHHGTTKNERYILGNVTDISSMARKENIDNPAIIIVGEVVNLHPDRINEWVEANKKESRFL
ncbi:MAG: uroporphyrinogen-III C-methyltransferase [Cytophagales bacterium]|nr:MAG: uroporphyrinogen-III C-methyltransferase [Cytophagales bacterium]